jgi:hypothetical protein
MSKMSFTSANRAADRENFPKLSLEQNETARIVVTDVPDTAFVHNFRAPKIVSGVVQHKGEDFDYAFLGNPICLGNEDILRERGMDAKNCPACAAAQEYPDMFTAPKRRYAVHIYQYQTNGTSKAPANGAGVVKVWSFTDQKFNELVDIFEEGEVEEPRNLDIVLTCENKLYQNMKIIPGQKTAWQANAATRSLFEETLAANKAKDIYSYLGRKMSADFIKDKIDEVKRNWSRAKGQSGESANDNFSGVERGSLDAGLAGLLDEPKATPAAYSAPVITDNSSGGDFDDILKSLDE